MEGLLLTVRKSSGQGLIELIAALAIIMIVLLALAGVGIMSIKNSDLAKNKALATKYAQEGMEKVRAYRDQSSWTVFLTACGGNLGTAAGLTPLPAPLTRTVTCDKVTDITKPKVIVTVSWTDTKGILHKSELVSYFTDKSLW